MLCCSGGRVGIARGRVPSSFPYVVDGRTAGAQHQREGDFGVRQDGGEHQPAGIVPVRAAPTADLGHPGGIQAALDDEGQPLQRRFGIHSP